MTKCEEVIGMLVARCILSERGRVKGSERESVRIREKERESQGEKVRERGTMRDR